jgi:alpha-galactosidase
LPPASYNHWSAFENNFTSETLKPAVAASAAAGLEYFCVDAAWFEGDFRKGIGNWDQVNKTKFPDGVAPFAEYVVSQGMKYGTWFEPEWAHEDSALYRAHPEWFHRTPEHSPYVHPVNVWSLDPQVHLMNFGLSEVREWWLNRIVRAYEEWQVRWIRWDFNQMPRPTWENGEAAGGVGWRQIEHVQGVYQTLDAILEACPDLFIEQSASGGHRIELGMVRRAHSFWMNDHTMNSDIVRALQHGLNTVLPGNYANTNLSQKRHDFDDYDFLSHGTGGFGYSGNLHHAPPSDFECYKNAVTRFKKYRSLLLGDYVRPTGQPVKYDDYTQVTFLDEGRDVTMEWNAPDAKRTASIVLTDI